MKPERLLAIALACSALLSSLTCRADALDRIDDALDFASGDVHAKLELFADVTVYAPDAPPPTLLFSDDDIFVAPRLAAFLDATLGTHVGFHAQARADR